MNIKLNVDVLYNRFLFNYNKKNSGHRALCRNKDTLTYKMKRDTVNST